MGMEGPPAPPEKKEHAPGSYEFALELFKHLKQEGLKNPFDLDDLKVQGAQDALDEWERATGLNMGGVGDIDRARQLVRSARILLDAGFTGKAVQADALERLNDLLVFARREGNQAVTEYLEAEVERFEPKSGFEKLLSAKLAEATAMEPTDAIGTLTGFLFSPQAKRMSPEQRQRIEDLRTAKRNEAGAPPPGQSWKKPE